MLPQSTMDLIAKSVRKLLSGTGVTLMTVTEDDPDGVHPQPALGRGVRIEMLAWGESLQRLYPDLPINIDMRLDPAKAVALALTRDYGFFDEQRRRGVRAASLGLRKPLRGDIMSSTAHLVADADMMHQLVKHCGTAGDARKWLDAQMLLQRSNLQGIESRRIAIPIIETVNGELAITFDMATMKPVVPYDDGIHKPNFPWQNIVFGPMNPRPRNTQTTAFWRGGTLRLGATALPDTMQDILSGRPLADLVGGTPMGERVIQDVEADDGHLIVRLEERMVRVDDVLGLAA